MPTRFSSPALAPPYPLSFAHRGGAARWPENTLLAFRKSIELGSLFVETDLRLSADGELVTFHDADVWRMTGVHGLVEEMTLAELQRLEIHTANGTPKERIPSFEEAVKLSGQLRSAPAVRFNVEIKRPHDESRIEASVDATIRAIEQYGLADRIVVAAEHHAIMTDFRKKTAGRIATSASARESLIFLIASKTGLWRWLPLSYQALQLPVHHKNWRIISSDLLRCAHARGVQVHAWTIDDSSEMRSLLQMGVDGIMTDYPDRLMDVVHELAGTDAPI